MAYEAKDYSHLIGMDGFSETLLKNHFTLYQGYVTNTNKLRDTLAQMAKDGKLGTPEYAELKRRMGFEWDGMRLHEYYFENLGGKGDLAQSPKACGAGRGGLRWLRRLAGRLQGYGRDARRRLGDPLPRRRVGSADQRVDQRAPEQPPRRGARRSSSWTSSSMLS